MKSLKVHKQTWVKLICHGLKVLMCQVNSTLNNIDLSCITKTSNCLSSLLGSDNLNLMLSSLKHMHHFLNIFHFNMERYVIFALIGILNIMCCNICASGEKFIDNNDNDVIIYHYNRFCIILC